MRSLRPEHADPDVHPNLWHMRFDLGHEKPCVALEQWWKEGGQGVELLGVRADVGLRAKRRLWPMEAQSMEYVHAVRPRKLPRFVG